MRFTIPDGQKNDISKNPGQYVSGFFSLDPGESLNDQVQNS